MGKRILNSDRFDGAILGFAIGDAFGHPARTLNFEQICDRFETQGCLELAVSKKSGTALFTDATQLMLFTADGILWADYESKGKEINYTAYVFYSYQVWLYTQTKSIAGKEYAWIFDDRRNKYHMRLLRAKGLYKNRYLDNVSIEALLSAKEMNYGKINSKINNNSDNGGLKRVLAAGLYFNYDPEIAFRAGADFAAITHCGTSGYLAAGCYSAIIAEIINGYSIEESAKRSVKILKNYNGHDEVLEYLDLALRLLYEPSLPPRGALAEIGSGKSAAEALAIAVFCAALHEESYIHTIQLAVNHDGESEVCASLAGGLAGACRGVGIIPRRWVKKIQYKNLLLDMSEQLYSVSVFNEE
ncbi:MAG: ADP-ribosylglycohydrolase family protein [Eubacterium sp.]|jgi:ADP-ribosylglycohydrolase|nr:ADP-ribosylglycohydrolase family protein [Eubacterium sp.]